MTVTEITGRGFGPALFEEHMSKKAKARARSLVEKITHDTHLDLDAATLRALEELMEQTLDMDPETSESKLLSAAESLAEWVTPINAADLIALVAPVWRRRSMEVGTESNYAIASRIAWLKHVHRRGPIPADKYGSGLRNGSLVVEHDI